MSKKKHFDNKKDLIREMYKTQLRAKKAEEIAFSSHMLLSLYVLHNKFGFGQERCEKFVNAVADADNLNLQDIRKYLLNKIGFAVELPNEHLTTGDDVDEVRIEM